jgi:hypothetical protein
MASLRNILVRGASTVDIEEKMRAVLENPTDNDIEELSVLMFSTRDIRGSGERRLFYDMFNVLYATYPQLLISLLVFIPRYGYWKDLFYLVTKHNTLIRPVMAMCYNQLLLDETALSEGRSISLFAKWLPREGKQLGRFAKEFANYIYGTISDMSYSQRMSALRKRISRLNAALKTVEIYKCANRWDEIDPSLVPKIAAKKGRAAFLNEGFCPSQSGLNLRYPGDPKRMICREKFQNYVRPEQARMDREDSFEAVRSQVKSYFAGLNE